MIRWNSAPRHTRSVMISERFVRGIKLLGQHERWRKCQQSGWRYIPSMWLVLNHHASPYRQVSCTSAQVSYSDGHPSIHIPFGCMAISRKRVLHLILPWLMYYCVHSSLPRDECLWYWSKQSLTSFTCTVYPDYQHKYSCM